MFGQPGGENPSDRASCEHTFVARFARILYPCTRVELSHGDGHFLAGFLEAEGSFGIRLNNGGQSWQCSMSLKLRDDDAELLVSLSRLTGLGRLSSVPARATSNPQVVWQIVSHAECMRLAELLREFPLHGRKRREAATWSEAVRALADHPRPEYLPYARKQLQGLRRYVDPGRRNPEAVVVPASAVAPYLGGFFTGEGHLLLSRKDCRVAVRVREDDRPLLEALAAITGLGSIYLSRAYGSSQPSAAWVIRRRDQLKPAVEVLDHAGLRGRKLREYEVWREAALEFGKPAPRRSKRLVEQAATKLAETRAYRGANCSLVHTDRHEEQRRALVEVLRESARASDGLLTAATYARGRASNPRWPTRNTIASTFGSWAAALTAAGLSHRCSGRARWGAACLPQEFTDDELWQRRHAREQVLEAVAEVAVDRTSDRAPTVHDYLAHRAANDRSLPCLSRLYDLFPSGWWSVLRQAGLPARPPRRA
jgi:hypothetical protein